MKKGEHYYTVVMQSWREWTVPLTAKSVQDAISRAEAMVADDYDGYLTNYNDATAVKVDMIREYEDGLTDEEPPYEDRHDPVPVFRICLRRISTPDWRYVDDFFTKDDPGKDILFKLHGPTLGDDFWLDLYRHPDGGYELSCRTKIDAKISSRLTGLLPVEVDNAAALMRWISARIWPVVKARAERLLEEAMDLIPGSPKFEFVKGERWYG